MEILLELPKTSCYGKSCYGRIMLGEVLLYMSVTLCVYVARLSSSYNGSIAFLDTNVTAAALIMQKACYDKSHIRM